MSTWFPGGHRDILIVDAQSGQVLQRVTQDLALDSNLLGAEMAVITLDSDRDGIYNIYGYDTQTEKLFGSPVLGGAFQPDVSPDGQKMLLNASARGFDIHEMPYQPETWQPLIMSGNRSPGAQMFGQAMGPFGHNFVARNRTHRCWRPSRMDPIRHGPVSFLSTIIGFSFLRSFSLTTIQPFGSQRLGQIR